jgi:hypothetical protein
MSDTSSPTPRNAGYPEITINPQVLHRSRLLFTISLAAFVALLILIFTPTLYSLATGKPATMHFDFGKETTAGVLLLALYMPHLLLFVTTIVSGFIGYKLVVAAGASPENPIPPSNYALLAPLIKEGKAESIDQYVRLSALSGFTGAFTKLGLTGLPLTTVTLTLLFATAALLPLEPESQKNFFDLTKLTLGAFIGSFVQRQVEQRRASEQKGDEARTPTASG